MNELGSIGIYVRSYYEFCYVTRRRFLTYLTGIPRNTPQRKFWKYLHQERRYLRRNRAELCRATTKFRKVSVLGYFMFFAERLFDDLPISWAPDICTQVEKIVK